MAQEVKFDTTVVPGKIVWSISETISNLKLSCEGPFIGNKSRGKVGLESLVQSGGNDASLKKLSYIS